MMDMISSAIVLKMLNIKTWTIGHSALSGMFEMLKWSCWTRRFEVLLGSLKTAVSRKLQRLQNR